MIDEKGLLNDPNSSIDLNKFFNLASIFKPRRLPTQTAFQVLTNLYQL